MYKICDLCSTYFLANEGYEVHEDYGVMCWLCWDEEEEKEKESKEHAYEDRAVHAEERPQPNPVFSVISSSFIVNDDKK